MAKILQEEELMELATEVAAEVLGLDMSEATPQTLLRSLEMDSLDQLEYAAALEDRFGVRIPDDRLKEIETVGGLIATLKELQATGPDRDEAAAEASVTGDEERLTDVGQ